MDWFKYLDENQIIEWRHWLHMHPEVANNEVNTSAFIEDTLRKIGNIEISRPTPTSVLGVIKGTKAGEGKTIGLRADMDALPVKEETDVPFKSQNEGVMHACGHDTHVSMLLGAANVLSKITDQFSGTIKLIFQHAEELLPGGAKFIVETGVLDDVDMFYAAHIIAPLKLGHYFISSGPVMAATNSFGITVKGRGAHGSMPNLSIDPIMVGADIVMNINQIVSRNINPFDNVALSFGQFASGDIYNVIPDTAELKGTFRTYKPEVRAYVRDRIGEIVEHICKAHGADYDIDYIDGYPPVVNDENATQIAWAAAEKVLGKDIVEDGERGMGSEDFSYYQEKAPGFYGFLGGGDESDGCAYPNHNPKFKVMDSAMLNGAKMYIGFALEAMEELSK